MIRAQHTDKDQIVRILTSSFDDNKSVNYIIPQDSKRLKRIKELMEYSFEMCNLFGEVFLTTEKNGCALLLYPDKKSTTLQSILMDIKFAFAGVGLSNIFKVMKREATIKQLHPDGSLYYLWFIGVDPKYQNNGIGSELMSKIICEAKNQNRIICLETSTIKNLRWYQKNGFIIYEELDLGYKLYCLKRE